MKRIGYISLILTLLFTSCYSLKEINEKTGLYEKSKSNKLFLEYGKDYNVTTKIYDKNTLFAKRITFYVFNCTNSVKKADEIIYYDQNRNKTKQVKYYFQEEDRSTILRSETTFENKKSKGGSIEILEYTVESFYEMKKTLLYE